MSYRRNARGLLGLLVIAALGAMAFAASAQAVTPLFAINGAAALQATVTGVSETALKFLVPNINLTMTCPEFEILEGLILSPTDADLKLLYKKCIVLEHKSPFKELPCHVSDVAGSKPELLHVAVKSLLLPVEFADGTYGALMEKLTSQINFLSGTGCPLPLKNLVTGEVCFKIGKNNDTKEPLTLTNPTIQGECPLRKVLEGLEGVPSGGTIKDELKFGLNPATIEGSGILSLAGAHAGLTLGVLLL